MKNKILNIDNFIDIYLYVFIIGKPSGYDRVRNAEIGNKVCMNIQFFSLCLSSF